MIIIAYFLLLQLGEYTRYKSEITPSHLKDTALSCGCRVFADTATAINLQSANFVNLTFKTQKNGAREIVFGHKASGEPLLCPEVDLLR